MAIKLINKVKDNFYQLRINKDDFTEKMNTLQVELELGSYTQVIERLINDKYKRIMRRRDLKVIPVEETKPFKRSRSKNQSYKFVPERILTGEK